MARSVIALLTDFGTSDHYAGAMRGVVLTIAPDSTLVDITHDIPPHDVLAGALELAASYKYFPRGTIFLVVVDPGVGSVRHGIAAEAGGYRFVAPDNGVLSLVFRDAAPKRVVEVTERKYARPTVSRTFEGRDRFAPAAAWLAKGIDLPALGRPLSSWQMLEIAEPTVSEGEIIGEVLHVDRFGSLVTNIGQGAFEHFAESGGLEITIEGHPVDKVVATYADADPASLCALFGSTEHLEIALNGGSAAAKLAVGRGARVAIRRT